MPAGRPKKNTDSTNTTDTNTQQQADENYSLMFAQSFLNTLVNPNIFSNPYLQNEIMKNLNMSPKGLDRDTIEKIIKNPAANEDALRDLAQYFENYIMHFKRLIYHYGSILSFDHYLEPTNADEEDMASDSFKRSYKKALNWVDKFNIKKSLSDVTRRIMLEDTLYYYVRESEVAISLQEMPYKWCKIIRKTDYGYQYAFNMMYFLQTGVDINDYAPEFKEYMASFINDPNYGKGYPFWVELDPIKAPVFKFDENRAGIVPPLMGLFIDTAEIATYKELLKTKTKLEVWKILISKIPMMNDGKSGRKNDFAIDAKTAGTFNGIIQKALPEGTVAITTPLEVEPIDFKQAENRNDIAGMGEDMFYRSSGTSPILFGEKNTTGSGIKASIQTDESFVEHLYGIFEKFINYQLKIKTGKYRFKIHLEGTKFNQQDRIDNALAAVAVGAPKTYLASAMGKTITEFDNLLAFEKSLNIVEKMIPVQSAHTASGEQGRPTQKNLTDSGQQTKDTDQNASR